MLSRFLQKLIEPRIVVTDGFKLGLRGYAPCVEAEGYWGYGGEDCYGGADHAATFFPSEYPER